MKRETQIIVTMGLFLNLCSAHGLAVHVSQIDAILSYYEENYSPGDPAWVYHEVISTFPEYFKFGSILPDMQYINVLRPAMENLYDKVENQAGVTITYHLN